MEEGVVRLHFTPHLVDTRFHAGQAGYHPPIEAPNYGVNVEGHLRNNRIELSSQVVPEVRSDADIIVMELNRRRSERRIILLKVCKGLMWVQMVSASLICLVWCVAQLK